VYMPSPYAALVRTFLKNLEAGRLEQKDLDPLVADSSVLHAPTAGEENVDHSGAAGFSEYFAQLRTAVGGNLDFKPQSFELRDRGAVSLVHAVGSRDGEEFVEHVRVVFGLADGRVKELWLDPGDRASFAKHLS
jgi:SnoaL-like domain